MKENNKDEQRETVQDKREQDDLLMEDVQRTQTWSKKDEILKNLLIGILQREGPVRFPT